jgi:hypothetical protein
VRATIVSMVREESRAGHIDGEEWGKTPGCIEE